MQVFEKFTASLPAAALAAALVALPPVAWAADNATVKDGKDAARNQTSSKDGRTAQNQNQKPSKGTTTAAEKLAQSDGSWVTLSGKVKSANADSFILDYGKSQVTVEMDDWDWYAEGYSIIPGRTVTVNGRIDDDFFEKRRIEASSVYFDGFYYYANATDEETGYYVYSMPAWAEDGDWVSVRGDVVSIEDDSLMLETGLRDIRVETDQMGYDPLDRQGFQKIEPGDRISVYGRLDDADLFDSREIEARALVVLSPNGEAAS